MGQGLEDIVGEDFQGGVTRHPKLSYGRHIVRIQHIELKDLFEGGQAYIVDAAVVESSDLANNPAGETRNIFYRDMQKRKWALQDIGKFIAAVKGYDLTKDKARFDAEVRPGLGGLSTSTYDARQAFTGMLVCVTVVRNVKEDGKDGYPRTTFSPATAAPAAPPAAYAPPPMPPAAVAHPDPAYAAWLAAQGRR